MNNNNLKNKLELHYFFSENDKSHSMDAVIRNRCEHELLQIFGSISTELNILIKTDTEAHKEGGLNEFYNFTITAEGQIILNYASFIISLIVSVRLIHIAGNELMA